MYKLLITASEASTLYHLLSNQNKTGESEYGKDLIAIQNKLNKCVPTNSSVIEDNSNQVRSSHYGGVDNPYEAIKVIDAWNLNFNLGNAAKYICRTARAGSYQDRKPKYIEDLKKARTYLDFEIEKMEKI